ncbi:MAG: DUF5916 domain-containing protein [Bacteroidota bacterium]
MKNPFVAVAVAVISLTFSHAQVSVEKNTNPQKEKVEKVTTAIRTSNSFKIDGVLDEGDWLNAPIATDLVQLEPSPGDQPSQKSEIKVLYDNGAIYVGAMLYDDNPKGIQRQLSQRDELGNTDWFGIFLNPYGDGINGVSFILTPVGVQFDAQYSVFGEDEGWDAVWQGEAKVVENGWVVEMKIPYSAIRFPDSKEQKWKINFGRKIQRLQEKSFWSEIVPTQPGFLNQFGTIEGISDIKSPVRLSATPFIATYAENYNDKAEVNPQSAWGRSFNAGMDIRYGLSDAFTLDMTLIPDFGEAVSDNQVLNLTQFEVRFDENRQFFTEGTELFNKGNLFYSRRIGGSPMHSADDFLQEGEEVIDAPQAVQLYNATKVSGRTTSGTGLGLFNAVAGATNATIRMENGETRRVQTNPLTNYNVMVVDQNLKNNSYFTIINTNVLRDGSDYDANATAGIFEFRNKAQSFRINANLKVSQQYFADNTAYKNHISNNLFVPEDDLNTMLENDTKTALFGHAFSIGAAKTNGNFNFGGGYSEESHTYDINDLGFLYNNNEQSFDFWMDYGKYKPFGIWNAMGGGAWTGMQRLYSPNKFAEYGINAWWWAQTKKFWRFNIWTYAEPIKNGNDFFEPRTAGRFFKTPKMGNIGMNINSDQRKKIQLGMSGNGGKTFDLYEGYWGGLTFSLRYRVNDKFNFRLTNSNFYDHNDVGFVADHRDEIILGKRDQKTTTNTINASYNFNKNMALTFRLRHYWSSVAYNEFNKLDEDGLLVATDYDEFNDLSYNFFNIDMIYRWRFAPGSDIFFIWKNATSDVSDLPNSIQYSYGRGVNRLGEFPQSNSFSLKVVYYLDYLSLVKN